MLIKKDHNTSKTTLSSVIISLHGLFSLGT
jgi:hypothetical protein